MGFYYNSYLEVDLAALCHNYELIQDWVGGDVGVIPVVKGNGYGMGLEAVAGALVRGSNVKMIACAHVAEALKLRESGLADIEILVVGGIPHHMVMQAVSNKLQVNVFDAETVKAIHDCSAVMNSTTKAHICIETGLNRTGVRPGADLGELLRCIKKSKHVEIVGAYTQYACADQYPGEPFTGKAFALYEKAVRQIEEEGIELQYKHTCSSGGIVWYRKGYLTHVRPGRLLYLGQWPQLDTGEYDLGISECFRWMTSLVSIHSIKKGESVGYNNYFAADKPMTVGTIAVGYGDGLYPPLAKGQGPVLVNEEQTRYLGLCMDQAFVDLTGLKCRLGDPVTIFGKSNGGAHLSPFTLAEFVHQPACYLMSLLTERVSRIYI